jgi:hypothetical protein
MRVRVIDHTGAQIAEGTLRNATLFRFSDQSRDGVRTIDQSGFKAPPSIGHCSVTFDGPTQVPLWYGGTYSVGFLDFSLSSGLHNVWGCGNDFDTDSSSIHPDDRDEIMRNLLK